MVNQNCVETRNKTINAHPHSLHLNLNVILLLAAFQTTYNIVHTSIPEIDTSLLFLFIISINQFHPLTTFSPLVYSVSLSLYLPLLPLHHLSLFSLSMFLLLTCSYKNPLSNPRIHLHRNTHARTHTQAQVRDVEVNLPPPLTHLVKIIQHSLEKKQRQTRT